MTCQRCGGYAYREKDDHGSWIECLICGWVKDDGRPIEYDHQAEKAARALDAHFRKTPARWRPR